MPETEHPSPAPAMTPQQMREFLQQAWVEAEAHLAREAEARVTAAAAGTISVYDAPVDQRGHLHTPETVTRRESLDHDLKASGKESITRRIDPETGQDCDLFTVAATAGIIRECTWCGQEPEFSYDGTVVRSLTECPHPDGYATEFTLTVTSGKVVVADDLRHVYDVDFDDFASYSTVLGQSQVMTAMAAIGCAYGPVGNSCPGLYQTGEDTYAVVTPGYDTDREPFAGTKLASIITDLRAYSIADHDDYLARGGTLDDGLTVVTVPNGVYRFTHHTGERSFDLDAWDQPQIFATITRTDA